MQRSPSLPALVGAAALVILGSRAQAAPVDLSGVWAARADGGQVLCRSLDRQRAFRATFNLQLKQTGAALEGYTDIGFVTPSGQSTPPAFFFGCPTRGVLSSSTRETPAGRALLQFAGQSSGAAAGSAFMSTVYVRRAETFPPDDRGSTGRLHGRYVALAPIGIIECRLHLVRVGKDIEGRYPFDEGCIVP